MDSLWTISDKILIAGRVVDAETPIVSTLSNNTFIIKKIKIALIMGRKFVHISAIKISHFSDVSLFFTLKKNTAERISWRLVHKFSCDFLFSECVKIDLRGDNILCNSLIEN